MAGAYRDAMIEGVAGDSAQVAAGVTRIHTAIEAFERNPNEALMLQDLLWSLPVLTSGPRDEGPNWAASSRELIFQRTDYAGRSGIYRIPLSGGEARKIATPQDGGDPDWSGPRE